MRKIGSLADHGGGGGGGGGGGAVAATSVGMFYFY